MVIISNPNIPLLHRILKTHDLCNRDTQSQVNRSASKVGWGCRQSWEEDVQARVSIAKVTLNPVIYFSLKQHFGLKLFTNFWMLYVAIEESRVIVDYFTVQKGEMRNLQWLSKNVFVCQIEGFFLPQDFNFLSRVVNSFSTGFIFRYKFSEFIVCTYFSLVKIEARVFKRHSVEELKNVCLRQTGMDLRF